METLQILLYVIGGIVIITLLVSLIAYQQFGSVYKIYLQQLQNVKGQVTLKIRPGSNKGQLLIPYATAKLFSLYPGDIRSDVGTLVINEHDEFNAKIEGSGVLDEPLIGQFVEAPMLIRTNDILTQIYNRYDSLFGDMGVEFDNVPESTIPPIEVAEDEVIGLLWDPISPEGVFVVDEVPHNTVVSRGRVEDLVYVVDLSLSEIWQGVEETVIPIYDNYGTSMIARMDSIKSDIDEYNMKYGKHLESPTTKFQYVAAIIKTGWKYMFAKMKGELKEQKPTAEEQYTMERVRRSAERIAESFHGRLVKY